MIRRFFIPQGLGSDDAATRQAALVHASTSALLLATLVMLAGTLLGGETAPGVVWIDTAVFGLILGLRWLAGRGRAELTGALLLALLLAALTAVIADLGTVHDPATAGFIVVVIIAGLLFKGRGMIATGAAGSLAVLGLTLAEQAGRLPQPHLPSPVMQWVTWTLLGAVSGFLVFYAGWLSRQALARARSEIAERASVAELLRRSEARYQSVIENMQEGLLLLNREFRYLYINKAAEMQGRRPKEELLGRTVMECWPGIESTEFFQLEQQVMRARAPARIEGPFSFPDGEERWFEWRIQPAEEGLLVLTADITERKLDENALRASEERFRGLFENMQEGFSLNELITDAEGRAVDFRVLAANAAYERHTGLKPAEIVGRTYTEIIGQVDLSRLEPYFGVAQSGEPLNFETYSPLIQRYLRVSVYRPAPGQFASIFEDITARKEAEAALRASEARFAAIFQAAADPIGLARMSDGVFLDVNDAFCRVFDTPREEVVGVGRAVVSLWDDAGQREQFVREILERGQASQMEAAFMTRSGRQGVVIATGSAVEIDGERCILIHAKDITERKQAEAALRESEEKFNRTLRASSVGICLVQLETERLADINEACLDLLGYAREEVLGRSAGELELFVNPEEMPVWREMLRAQGMFKEVEAAVRRKSGEIRYVKMSATLFEARGEALVMALLDDVTAQKQVEAALLLAQTELEEHVAARTLELAASNKILDLFVRYVPAAAAMFDREMRYLAVSRRFMADWELGEQNIIGRSHYEVFPDLPENYREVHRRAIAEQAELSGEGSFPRADGRVEWGRWQLFPWYESPGKVGGAILFVELTTEHRRMEERARQNEEKFIRVFETGLAVKSLVRVDSGQLVDVNQAFLKLFEYRREEVIGRTPQELGLYVEAQQPEELDRLMREQGCIENLEMRLRTRTGKEIDVLTSTQRIEMDGVLHAITNSVDISERKQAERALRAERDALAQRAEERTAELRQLNNQLVLEVERRKQFEAELSHLATSDPLTGIFNRRHFITLSAREYKKALRYGRPLSLVLLSVDRFDEISEAHGQAGADELLQQVVQHLTGQIRTVDILARYGGEEFVILLPETGLASGLATAERIRQSAEKTPFRAGGQELWLTLSLGVADLEQGAPRGNIYQLLGCADQALYQAKISGLNRVCAYGV